MTETPYEQSDVPSTDFVDEAVDGSGGRRDPASPAGAPGQVDRPDARRAEPAAHIGAGAAPNAGGIGTDADPDPAIGASSADRLEGGDADVVAGLDHRGAGAGLPVTAATDDEGSADAGSADEHAPGAGGTDASAAYAGDWAGERAPDQGGPDGGVADKAGAGGAGERALDGGTADGDGTGASGPGSVETGVAAEGPPGVPGAPQNRTDGEEELADPERLRAAVEAVLLVVDTPTSTTGLAQVLGRAVPEVEAALRFLQEEYEAGGRGLDLREVAGGWRLYSREDFAAYVERFILDGQQARLTQAALETLAVIAYRQPVTRSRIAGIRGVSVDAVMRTLLTRGLVEECGADPDTGGGLYRTTRLFLEKLGLRSLDELPSLAPLLPDTSQLDDVAVST